MRCNSPHKNFENNKTIILSKCVECCLNLAELVNLQPWRKNITAMFGFYWVSISFKNKYMEYSIEKQIMFR